MNKLLTFFVEKLFNLFPRGSSCVQRAHFLISKSGRVGPRVDRLDLKRAASGPKAAQILPEECLSNEITTYSES